MTAFPRSPDLMVGQGDKSRCRRSRRTIPASRDPHRAGQGQKPCDLLLCRRRPRITLPRGGHPPRRAGDSPERSRSVWHVKDRADA
jgi:hypothetical protein